MDYVEAIKNIDIIVAWERGEIKFYRVIGLVLLIIFFTALFLTLAYGGDKVLALLLSFLSLAVGYLPMYQIIKRRKKITYLDKIVRVGVRESNPNRPAFIAMLEKAIEIALNNQTIF